MNLIPLWFAAALLVGTIAVNVGGCFTNSTPLKEARNHPEAGSPDQVKLRAAMVRDQLRGRDIVDERVLAAMAKVPRDVFVPASQLGSAYDDTALPLAQGQTISQPYIVAFMSQLLRLSGGEKVLEIGTGSGYQAAILAEVAGQVYTIEILPELSGKAQNTLGALGYNNIQFKIGDGYQGWLEVAPFDAIIVTAAPDHVPQPLVDQLKVGGRMVIPVGMLEQDLILIERTRTGAMRQTTIPVRFVPMTGRALQHPAPN